MAAPERFADRSDSSCTAGAALRKFGRYRGNIGLSPPNALKIYGFTA
jgi:hypothetical protein